MAEKAQLRENDRPVPKTPLYTKHLKDWTASLQGNMNHTALTEATGLSLSPSLDANLAHSHSLLFKLEDCQQRWIEWGRDQRKDEQKRLQHYQGTSLFASLTDSREKRPGEKRKGEGVKRKYRGSRNGKKKITWVESKGKGIWGEELLAGACCRVCDGKDSLLALVYVGKETLWSVHVCPYMCMCY